MFSHSESRHPLIGKIVLAVFSIMLIFGMAPISDFFSPWSGDSKAYAAAPADGTGWTASGENGLKYFQNIYGTGTKVTSLSYGQQLSSGTYYIMNSISLAPTSSNKRYGTSALRINGTVRLVLLSGSMLSVTGGAANGTTGAGAGIELPSGSTLI